MKGKFLLALCINVICLHALGQNVKVNGLNYLLDTSDNTAIVSKNTEVSGNIVIPATISYKGSEYQVIEIGEEAFALPMQSITVRPANEKITGVTLPEGLKTIGEAAFAGCSMLTSIKIPNSTKNIENSAFLKSGLTNVTLGTNVKRIGRKAFAQTKIKKVIIPNSVTTLGELVFWKCSKLEKVVIGNGVKTLCNGLFSECPLLEEVQIGNHVTTIERNVFEECDALEEVILPESLLTIESAAFYKCNNLVSLVIPANVKELPYATVYKCENFETLIVTSSNTKLSFGNQQTVVWECPAFKGIIVNK